MKFLVPNYSCLQYPWLGGYRSPFSLSSVLNWICWPPSRTKFLGTPLVICTLPITVCSHSSLCVFPPSTKHLEFPLFGMNYESYKTWYYSVCTLNKTWNFPIISPNGCTSMFPPPRTKFLGTPLWLGDSNLPTSETSWKNALKEFKINKIYRTFLAFACVPHADECYYTYIICYYA